MNILNPLLQVENWFLPNMQEYTVKIKDRRKSTLVRKWTNDGSLSPLDIYCYLKARFGEPNGLSMSVRKNSTDNIIQWHYTVMSGESTLEVMGTNSSLEFIVYDERNSKLDWVELTTLLKKDFASYGRQMGEVRNSLQKWTIFINPFKRLNDIVNSLCERIEKIDLEEPKRPSEFINKRYARRYIEAREKWLKNIEEARILGASLRMLAPVFAESFVNLVIFLLAKEDVKNDERIYQDLIRKQIDVRVKSLHLFCENFSKINGDEQEMKDFLALMNFRNDFLHGNVDPLKFKSQEVYFDDTIPLFKDEQSLQSRLINDSIRYITRDESIKDVQTVKQFIYFILQHVADESREHIIKLMDDSQPGWRQDTGKVNSLFPSTIAEFLPIKNE